MLFFPRRRHRQIEPTGIDQTAKKLLAYEIVTQRELEHDALTWQTPTMVLTAQAFLFTITLDDTFSSIARVTSAGLGVVVILLSMQLMAKHRYLGTLEREQLAHLEEELGLPRVSGHGWAKTPEGYRDAKGNPTPYFRKWSSYRTWIFGLWVILIVNVGVAVPAIVDLLA